MTSDKSPGWTPCLFQSCPDSVRTRVSDTGFSTKFLKNIPVLQWARHATREQYERLSRYPGSHGWGGVQYDSESLPLLSCADIKANLDCGTFIWISWEGKARLGFQLQPRLEPDVERGRGAVVIIVLDQRLRAGRRSVFIFSSVLSSQQTKQAGM